MSSGNRQPRNTDSLRKASQIHISAFAIQRESLPRARLVRVRLPAAGQRAILAFIHDEGDHIVQRVIQEHADLVRKRIRFDPRPQALDARFGACAIIAPFR